MRIVLSGSRSFGAATLAMCLGRGHTVTAVWSPAVSASRLFGERPDRLREAAAAAGVPWHPAGSMRADLLPAGTDLIIAAHSHDYIGRPTRLAARLGAIGYHPSLLPLHRGRDAVEWAVRMRERVTGGTVYWLADSVDAGDVAAQRHVFVRPDDDAAELWRRELMPLGLQLLADVLADLESGVVVRIPQQHRLATWEPSVGRPPVFRPELPQIGQIGGGYRVIASGVARDARAMRDSSVPHRTAVNLGSTAV